MTLSTLSALSACSSSGGDLALSADSSMNTGSDSDRSDVEADVGTDATRDAFDEAGEDWTDATTDGFDPNPTGCPKDDPGFGPFHQPCTLADTVRCRYRDDCPMRPSDAGAAVNEYSCHDDGSGSHWTLVSAAYTPDCPTTEPAAGSPCPCSPHMQYIACLYGTCEGIDRSYANCEGPEALERAWRVAPVSCNPPEPDGGGDGDARDGG